MITVTSTTHPEGDLCEFYNLIDAYEYASELVSLGLDPVTNYNSRTLSWEDLFAEINY